ncbi:MAG: hypothetical protein AB2651_05005 [Candidatus Thiodiazotropha sp.]
MNEMETTSGEHFSDIEVQDQLENLADSDIARALQVYRVLGCTARTGLTEHDVFDQVVMKTLSRERLWPRDVSATHFLIQTGKSVISNEEEKHAKLIHTPTVDELMTTNECGLTPTSATDKLCHAPSETCIEHSQSENMVATWIEKIQQLFKDDPEADCFLKHKLEEQKKSRILVLCDFTDQIYRNVEKRIKDKVRKRFPNGLPWWELNT